MRVLISAFACEPHRGSEPGVGWNWAVQAARFNEVWVITHGSQRAAIEAELLARPVANLRFEYVDAPAWSSALGWSSVVLRLQYLVWQVLAYGRARDLHKTRAFDLAQHVTFVSFRYPTFLAWLGVPFIWGPIGGGERAPVRFYPTFGVRGALYELLRDASSAMALANPLTWICIRRARQIVAVTPDTANRLPRHARAKTVIEPAIGIEAGGIPATGRRRDGSTCRLLFVGQLVHRKGLHLLIPALAVAVAAGGNVSLTIVGDGPLRRRLERLVSRHNLQRHVSFAGAQPRAEVLSRYQDHDVFVFPSLQDSGGGAVLEAMAAGLPVICLDLGGPGQSVTDATGIRVPAHGPRQVIAGLGAAIARLAADPGLRHEMGVLGRRRAAQDFQWDRKSDFLRMLYGSAERDAATWRPPPGHPVEAHRGVDAPAGLARPGPLHSQRPRQGKSGVGANTSSGDNGMTSKL